MALTIGAWIVPAFITLSAFGVAAMRSEPSTGWFDIGTGIFYYPVAMIVSLTAWLVWALLT
jgi:hypothetical protein